MEEPKKVDATPIPPGKLKIKVFAPFRVYYDGVANSISAINDTGPFDILGKHHNFITLLNKCDLTVRDDKGDQKLPIERGIMHVKKDKVTVFLDV